VLVVVLAVLLAIAVSVVQSPHVEGRRIQCANNMRNLGLALINYQTSKNRLPNAGTFFDDPARHQGDPLKSNIYQALTDPGTWAGESDFWLRSWVVEILPYIDAQDIYNAWDKGSPYLSMTSSGPNGSMTNHMLGSTSISILRCPDDYTAPPGQGNLSYVVNGGFARWHAVPVGWSGSRVDGKATNGDVLQWVPPDETWKDTQTVSRRLGVMFLGTQTGNQPWDIATTPADITDGMSQTLLVAENTLAGYSPGTPYSGHRETNWACPLPNFAMFLGSDDVCRTARSPGDCLGGQLARGPKGDSGKGWARANQAGTFEDINFGQSLTVEGSFPFANSAHPGGANFVFCDGAVRFLSSTIDGSVYAALITPAGTVHLPPQLRQAPLDVESFAN
jgi:prepilin-type processing-associated H-X9-DG protein